VQRGDQGRDHHDREHEGDDRGGDRRRGVASIGQEPAPHAVDEDLYRGHHQQRQAEEDRQVASEQGEREPDELAEVAMLVEIEVHAPQRG
jgi:hypothetical protein